MILLLLGCAPCLLEREGLGVCGLDTAVTETGDSAVDTGPPPVRVSATDLGGGVFEGVIDATEYQIWTYLSLSQAAEVHPEEPTNSTAWDLGFERYLIMSNGGVSGTGGVEAVALDGQDFDSLSAAPTEGYVQDLPDDDDENENPEYALGDWFAYTTDDHTLMPLDRVYVLRGVDGIYYKLKIEDYYDDAGTPAILTMRWAAIAGP